MLAQRGGGGRGLGILYLQGVSELSPALCIGMTSYLHSCYYFIYELGEVKTRVAIKTISTRKQCCFTELITI